MKKRVILVSLVSATMLVGAFVALSFNREKDIKVEGYSTSTLPTTIDLNDTSATNIRNYYSSLNGLDSSQRQGNNLLKNLKNILKNGQKYYSYDSGNAIWQIYEIADRDWDKSPASSTTYGTYNPSTNKITNYSYGTSSSSSKNNPYIHALYINRNVTNQTTAWDDHQQNQWGINREHVWPKAEGFETAGAGGARGDPMHLIAGNGYVNNIHSNYFYGYVNTSSSYTNCGSKYSNVSGNYLGSSKTSGGSTNVFEPQDSDKGDIARAIFYMVARYNYLSGSDSDGIDSNNPNLSLSQSLSDWSSTGYSSTTSRKGYMGIMTDLLAWHHADPVDEYEIHRNNLLYTNYTNNRNPFIDFPEWADFIWGSVNYNGREYISHNTTPTGYATPSTDTINGYNSGGSSIPVTGVTLNKNAATIAVGGTEELVATVTPKNATNKAVTWTSSNTSKATVSDGVVTGKAAGTSVITAKTQDGNYTATCTITVKALSSISVSGQQTEFTQGDDFNFGGTVTAHYTDSSTVDVTSSADFSGYNLNEPGEQTVTVSYGGKTTSYTVTVASTSSEDTESGSATASKGVLSGWTMSGTGTYSGNDYIKFDTTGDLVYKLDIFSDDVSQYMTDLKVTVTGKINGTATSTNSYKVEAIAETDGDITTKASDQKTGASVVGASDTDTVFEMSSELSGTTGIRVTYANKGGGNWAVKSISWVATYVLPSVLDISLDTSEVKTSFIVDDEFTYDDLVVTAHLRSGDDEIVVPDSVDVPDMSTAGIKEVVVHYSGCTASYEITVVDNKPTEITAYVKADHTFYVGETITKDNIVVMTNLGDEVTDDATFANYQFTYEDAASGGALTNKELPVNYGELSTNLVVQVQRREHLSSVTDTLNADSTGNPQYYSSWTYVSDDSSAEYSGYSTGSTSYIQLRSDPFSDGHYAGIVTSSSGGKISRVEVSWNSETYNKRTLNIYGKNTAYSSPDDLFDENKQGTKLGTIVKGTSTYLEITGSYLYVGVCSDNKAMYLDEISFTYGSVETASTVADFVMFEDTENQCVTKTSQAITYYNALSASEKAIFMTSDDYVISKGRERFEAWLRNQGKEINQNDNTISAIQVGETLSVDENNYMIIIIAITVISTLSLSTLLIIKKRKRR